MGQAEQNSYNETAMTREAKRGLQEQFCQYRAAGTGKYSNIFGCTVFLCKLHQTEISYLSSFQGGSGTTTLGIFRPPPLHTGNLAEGLP
jgi:hypothetical protein